MLKLLLPVLSTLLALPAHARVEAMFSPESDVLGAARVELASAKKRVELVLPSLEPAELVDAAAKLAKEGKAVRVLTAPQKKCKACEALEKAGADVRFVSPAPAHAFALIDGPRGRKNDGSKSRLALVSGDASLLVLYDEGDTLLSYQDEFNFLWAKARDFKSRAKHAKVSNVRVPRASLATFSSANVLPTALGKRKWAFQPALEPHEGAVARLVVGAIDHAYDSVDVAAASFGRADVTLALQRALERGVRVRVLLPATAFQGLQTPEACAETLMTEDLSAERDHGDECLAAVGAEVRYLTGGLHYGTFVVVDGKRALTGNFGFSQVDETGRFGSVLSLRGEVARKYQAQFDKLFGNEGGKGKRLASLCVSEGAVSIKEMAMLEDCR